MRALALALALALVPRVRAALGQAPASPAPAATVTEAPRPGTYALELTTDDGTLAGALVLARQGDALTAQLTVRGHSPRTESFARKGPAYELVVGTPEYTVTYALTFAGDAVRGTFAMSTGGRGSVSGKRES